MAYRQSLMKYAERHGVKRAGRRYNKSRSYIYFWKARWDGTVESLACQSRRPHSHPNEQITYPGQRVQVDVKVVPRPCITDPELKLFQYTSYTPRHNGKGERSHREDRKRFYSCLSFFSLLDL